jgi:hypothetical protein
VILNILRRITQEKKRKKHKEELNVENIRKVETLTRPKDVNERVAKQKGDMTYELGCLFELK